MASHAEGRCAWSCTCSICAVIGGLTALENLRLERCNLLSDVGALTRLRQLRHLSLAGCVSVKHAGVQTLARGGIAAGSLDLRGVPWVRAHPRYLML